MTDELIEYMETKKLVSIYKYGSANDFSLGFIDRMDNNFIRIKSLSNDGIYLGYEVIKISSISKIETDSIYDKKIQFLAKNFKANYNELVLLGDNEDLVVIDILKEAMKKKIVVSLITTEDPDDNIFGIIKKISSKTVSILSLDDYGEEMENVVIYIDDILSIDCGEKKLQIIQFLRDNNFKI